MTTLYRTRGSDVQNKLLSQPKFDTAEESAIVRQLRAELQEARAAQKELTHFLETASIGVHWLGPDGTIVWANEAEMELLGYEPEEYIGHHIAEFHADREAIDEILACLSRRERLRGYEARVKCKDGSIKTVEIDSSVYSENGKFLHTQCFTRDVTDRKRAAKRLRTQDAITRVLAESTSLSEAAPKLLRAICENADWDVGAFWEVDEEGKALRCHEVVCGTQKEVPKFAAVTRAQRFAPGVGMPGRVWKKAAPVWIADVTLDKNFPRLAIAAEEGLHGAFGFPITVGGEVLGVVEFFSKAIREPEAESLTLLAALGSQIGQFTQRKRAEAALRESERRFRQMIDALPVAIYTTDAEGRLTHFNPAAVEFSGRVPELGTDQWCVSWKLYWPDGTPLPHGECPMAIAIKEGRTVRGAEAIAERPDGKRIWFAPYPTPLRDLEGRVVGGINMLVDITERKQAEETSSRLAAIVQSSDDAIVSKDLNGIITSWNQGAERLFGYNASETIGRPVTMLMPEEVVNEEPGIVQRIREGRPIDHYETVRRRKDGTLIQVSLSVSPVKDAKGRTIGASKIARDITERKKAEEALTRAQAQLREHAEILERVVAERTAALQETITELESFSYSISHDMRGPLRAMQGFAMILQEEAKRSLSEEHAQYLDRIYKASNRLDRLIQDVLNYSGLTRAEITLRPVELNKLLQEIVHNYPAFQYPTAVIQIETPLPRVKGHEGYLTQCFSNLLGNAVKFVPKGVKPQVRVWSESRGEHVRVWVEDNGIGIAPQDQQRIFNIYERVYANTQYEGTGIGLSIVRKSVERMGGTVGVESEVGKGSRFWVELLRL